MNHTKIVELFINDEFDESGIEAISLVSRPAHDETWMAFNRNKETIITNKFDDEEKLNPYIVVEDDFCNINKEIFELGEPYEKLINEGYDIVRVEKITPQVVHKMNEEKFTESNPNAESSLDYGTYLIRYKYIGIRDNKNRTFCRQMLQAGKVYTIEDIDRLTDSVANEQFGFYSIFMYRGSYNCRHQWVRLLYKKGTEIRNRDTSVRGLVDVQGLGPNLQPNTVPDNQRGKVEPRVGSSFNEQKNYHFDDEKRIIVGAAMVPNKMIHRYDELGNLYYVFFSKVSIKKMADKFLKQRRTDETSVEHDGIKLGSDKVYITESWVSEDPIKDKSAAYGFNLPAGTWYVSMYVADQNVWDMIKKKALTGFSVEGLFAEKSVFSQESKQINQIKEILKSINDE